MSFRGKRKVINDSNGKHQYESTPLLYLRPEQGERISRIINVVQEPTKLKIANNIHNSNNQRIKLVKSFQLKKAESHLRSILKDAKKYSDELECAFHGGATIFRSGGKKNGQTLKNRRK